MLSILLYSASAKLQLNNADSDLSEARIYDKNVPADSARPYTDEDVMRYLVRMPHYTGPAANMDPNFIAPLTVNGMNPWDSELKLSVSDAISNLASAASPHPSPRAEKMAVNPPAYTDEDVMRYLVRMPHYNGPAADMDPNFIAPLTVNGMNPWTHQSTDEVPLNVAESDEISIDVSPMRVENSSFNAKQESNVYGGLEFQIVS